MLDLEKFKLIGKLIGQILTVLYFCLGLYYFVIEPCDSVDTQSKPFFFDHLRMMREHFLFILSGLQSPSKKHPKFCCYY